MMRESSKTRARKPKVPSPQAATGGGGDNRASLAKRSVLRWVCCRVGPNEFWQARCLSAVCGLSTVVSFDEEKPPCRAVQGGAGKHRGESEAYTNLAGGWKGGLSRLEGRGKRGPGQNGRCGRVPGSLVVHILTTIGKRR